MKTDKELQKEFESRIDKINFNLVDVKKLSQKDFIALLSSQMKLCWVYFAKALTEHDKEIISKIDEMLEKLESSRAGGRLTQTALAGVNLTIIRLTELKQWMEEKL